MHLSGITWLARAATCAALITSLPPPGGRGDAAAQARTVYDTTYSQPAADVIGALTSVLVERGALQPAQAQQATTALMSAMGRQEEGQFRTQSVSVDREALGGLIPAGFARYLTDAGGRYVLEIRVAGTGPTTRVSIAPVIVITIPGTENPLGGRVVPSSGALERQIVAAMRQRLPQ